MRKCWGCCVVLVLVVWSGIVFGAIPEKERAALIALYNETNGDDWSENSGWKGNNNESDGFSQIGTENTWFGIDVSDDHVVMINLENNSLSGNLPDAIGNLTGLKHLYLRDNKIEGEIPSTLGNLTSLEELLLNNNDFSGSIPVELKSLHQLLNLNLAKNRLSGSIPTELGELGRLESLSLELNNLTGGIPMDLCELEELRYLSIGENRISGSIPQALGNLSNLRKLYLQRNKLGGVIPKQLKNLTMLGFPYVDIGRNCLYTEDTDLKAWLDSVDPDWDDHQSECNSPPTITLLSIANDIELTRGYSLSISWDGDDPDSEALVDIYYDEDEIYNNGNEHNLIKDAPEDGSFMWDTSGVTPGTYYLFGYISDGENSAYDYAEGCVTVISMLGNNYDLKVESDPVTQVPITVASNDNKGQVENTTNFTLSYETGTEVTLTAQEFHSGWVFVKWLIDGIEKSNTTTVSVTMNRNHTAQAVYLLLTHTLTVQSYPFPGVNITVSPVDNNSNGNGNTHFTRTYESGTDVELTAPPSANGNDFVKWIVDDVTWGSNRTIKVIMGSNHTAVAHYSQSEISLNRDRLNFGCIINSSDSCSQTFLITGRGGGVNWSVSSDKSWLSVNPNSGTGSGFVEVSVNPAGLSEGTYTGVITVSDPYVESPGIINVTLRVYRRSNTSAPFGNFSTPDDGFTVCSSVPVTGWVLDDTCVESVKIYREEEGRGLVFIGGALFVEGARPDVETAYPDYPNNYKAGWGYMLLTNFLPNSGNGTFTLHAIAVDKEGKEATLGTKRIVCDNAHAEKPFGAVDTPGQGETISGSNYRNNGWVLTPLPNYIPEDGSTISVYIDGINIGHPVYNICRSDISQRFPGYANCNGAGGHLDFDTTTYDIGVHTISWHARDNWGNEDGIGSRYFTINNSGERSQKSMGSYHLALDKDIISRLPADYSVPIDVKRGYEYDVELEALYPDEKGFRYFSIKELERVEIHFVDYTSALEYFGFQVVGEELRPLPVGSTLDREKGIFYWQPGPGFYGDYEFVFLKTENDEVKKIKLKVNIRSSTTLEVEVYTNLRERSRIFQDFKLNLHTDIFLEESRFNLVSYATPRLNRILMDTSTTIAFFDSFNLGRPLAGIYGEGSVPLSPICANLAISKPEMKEDSIVIVENLNFGDLTLVPVIETVIKKDSSFYGDSIKTCLSDKVIAEDTLTRYFTVDNLQLEGRADFKIFTVGSEPVRVIRGNGISIEPEMVYPDNDGVINVRIVNMERLKIHLDEYLIQVTKARTDQSMSITHQGTEPFYSGYLVVNDELRSLPIGSTMDTGKGIFYWQPGPEFLGDFEFAFFKEEGDETKRIRVLVKISAR